MMELMEAMEKRHSVRNYTDKRLSREVADQLRQAIQRANEEGNLNIQLFTEESQAFQGMLPHYGTLKNVKNYIALVGPKGDRLEERCGYYGEKLVLLAQQLGLNTCWVALTYNKRKCKAVVGPGEKLVIVIALGYGVTQGAARKTKPMEQLSHVEGEAPDWFRRGLEAAQLAPTAMNQQKFLISLRAEEVSLQALSGPYAKVDLGIVRCHFEFGAAEGQWHWAEQL